MIVCCAFIHSRIPGFWDLGIVYLCFQFLGIPFEFLIYYGAKFRNRWFLGLWLVLFCFKLITYILYFVKPFKSWKVSWKKKCRAHCTFNCNVQWIHFTFVLHANFWQFFWRFVSAIFLYKSFWWFFWRIVRPIFLRIFSTNFLTISSWWSFWQFFLMLFFQDRFTKTPRKE